MEKVQSFDSDGKFQRGARCETLEISNNKEKELIKINGNGIVIIIHDTSISSCRVEPDGRLVIETVAGRQIIFQSDSQIGTFRLIARLNKVLENSNCNLIFESPKDEKYEEIAKNINEIELQKTANINGFAPFLGALFIIALFLIGILAAINSGSNITEKPIKKEKKEVISQKSTPILDTNDTKIASIIVSVSCAGSKGLIPRNQMGGTMKEMFAEAGIDATQVYSNWDYYWGIAKEMDAYNKTYCLKQ